MSTSIRDGKRSDDPEKVKAAEALEAKLNEVLESENHRWFLNKLNPAELEERKKRQEEFKKRYGN